MKPLLLLVVHLLQIDQTSSEITRQTEQSHTTNLHTIKNTELKTSK